MGGSTIQHLQSDVRGSSSSKPHSGYHGSGGENSRRGSATEFSREALPSPSRSTSPPHESSESRPASVEPGKPSFYTSHHRRPSTDVLREKQGNPRGSSHYISQKREEEYDEMEVEVDEIENDMDP